MIIKGHRSNSATPQKDSRGFHSSFIHKLAASYLVVVLLPIVVCGLLAARNYREAYQREASALQTSVSRAAASIDNLLDKMHAAVTLLDNSDEARSLSALSRRTDPEKIRSLIQVRSFVSSLTGAVSSGGELLVLSDDGGFMVTTSTVNIRTDVALEQLQARYADYDWATLMDTDSDLRHAPWFDYFTIPAQHGPSALALGKTVYARGNQANVCTVFVAFPQEIMGSMALDEAQDCAVFWKDQLVACTTQDAWPAPDDAHYISASAWPAGHPQIRVEAVRSRQSVADHLAPIVRSLVMLVVSLCAMTCLLILLLARVNNKPFDELLVLLFGDRQAQRRVRRNWQDVNASVRSILTDNQNLRVEMRQQDEGLRQNLLYGLISSTQGNQRAALNMLTKLGAPVDEAAWALLIVCDADADSTEPLYTAMLVKKLLDRHFSRMFDQISIDAGRYLVLIDGDCSADELRQAYDAFQHELADVAGILPSAAAVRIGSMAELFDAYTTAVITAGMSGAPGLEIAQTQREPGGAPMYSDGVSEQLRQAVRDGDYDGLTRCMATIEGECLSGPIDAGSLNRLLRCMCMDVGSVLMRLNDIPQSMTEQVMSNMSELSASEPLRFTKNAPYVLEPALTAIRDAHRRGLTGGSSTELGRSIMAFIDERMSDPGLSLIMIAAHFGLSESYVSTLVKSETGIGFVSYCGERRVAMACQALRQGDSVKDAAEKAGYASQLTFRRAFKKVMGVNPSEFAQSVQKQP